MSVNNRVFEINTLKEKDTARTICICITTITFTLLILAVYLPSIYAKYYEKATKEAQISTESNIIPKKDSPLSLVYTIQVGSFNDLNSAIKRYEFVMNELIKEDLSYLRIEKVGEYYAIRIGKFEERVDAKLLNDKIRAQLNTVMMMKAYIKRERLQKLHSL